jgi:hypothetical protein
MGLTNISALGLLYCRFFGFQAFSAPIPKRQKMKVGASGGPRGTTLATPANPR